jgi:hypothetical protein
MPGIAGAGRALGSIARRTRTGRHLPVVRNKSGKRSAGRQWRGSRERGRRRTRQDQISLGASRPGEIAELRREPHRTKKTCFFCRTGFGEANFSKNTIQPFDLMSRRHPLSSTRAVRFGFARRSGSASGHRSSQGSCDVPASNRRQFLEKRSYFFFLATLRVFFAVFFTALFAFFAFLAFLAMLPS